MNYKKVCLRSIALLSLGISLSALGHGCMRHSEDVTTAGEVDVPSTTVTSTNDISQDTAESVAPVGEAREKEAVTTSAEPIEKEPEPEIEIADIPGAEQKKIPAQKIIESKPDVKPVEATPKSVPEAEVLDAEKRTMESRPPQQPKAKHIKIGNVTVYPWSFNPSVDQKTTISYRLSEPAEVWIAVYGPNSELIDTIVDGQARDDKLQKETWDGKDASGRIVANEAYFFTIRAENDPAYGWYDPTIRSGGEKVNPRDIHFKPRENTISYVLPKASRVLVRAGLDEGPMLNTLLNWIPRSAGLCTEHWRGADRQNVQQYSLDPRAVVVIQAYALPENSVIAVGNIQRNYRDEFLSQDQTRILKPQIDKRESWLEPITSPHWYLPVCLDKDPIITMSFPELEATKAPDPTEPISISGDRAIVRVDISDVHSRRFIAGQQFELVVFVDNERLWEAEQGYLPFNWSWNIGEHRPGDHLLTVNLVTRQQHVGTASQRVKIVRSE